MESIDGEKIYHNCRFRNRNDTNRLIGEGKICIVFGR